MNPAPPAGPAARLEALLQRHWWQPRSTLLARLLAPLAWLYGVIAAHRQTQQPRSGRRLPVRVLVVGNLVVGGAGKTPTVIAVVTALKHAGHRPAVVSRGYGRADDTVRAVENDAEAREVGDEPLLIRRRTAVPVWVGRDRAAAARALCRAHVDVDVIVSDDGLQHHALARDAELIVFDERGAGNGRLLPAGPMREPLPRTLQPHQRVLYTSGRASTRLPGVVAQRRLRTVLPLTSWLTRLASPDVRPLASLRGVPLLAMAGLAAPEKFFGMLEAEGLTIRRLPLPDHHDYAQRPWPADTPDVITTEKDAVKLDAAWLGATRVWVAPLDLQLPAALIDDLSALLFPNLRHEP